MEARGHPMEARAHLVDGCTHPAAVHAFETDRLR
jgi:hypothetical protein